MRSGSRCIGILAILSRIHQLHHNKSKADKITFDYLNEDHYIVFALHFYASTFSRKNK